MESKKLYRSRKNSLIAGICGGLADYFNTDPVLIRVLFVIAILAGGGGVLVYIILWIITPPEENVSYRTENNNNTIFEENPDVKLNSEKMEDQKKQNNGGSLSGGLILIALGGIFLIDRFVPDINFGDLWPLILIVIGVILISKSIQRNKN